MREEADVLNELWDFAARRFKQTGHPYYLALAKDMRALVRGYDKGRLRDDPAR